MHRLQIHSNIRFDAMGNKGATVTSTEANRTCTRKARQSTPLLRRKTTRTAETQGVQDEALESSGSDEDGERTFAVRKTGFGTRPQPSWVDRMKRGAGNHNPTNTEDLKEKHRTQKSKFVHGK
jgi:hypothetical protein